MGQIDCSGLITIIYRVSYCVAIIYLCICEVWGAAQVFQPVRQLQPTTVPFFAYLYSLSPPPNQLSLPPSASHHITTAVCTVLALPVDVCAPRSDKPSTAFHLATRPPITSTMRPVSILAGLAFGVFSFCCTRRRRLDARAFRTPLYFVIADSPSHPRTRAISPCDL